MTCSIMPRIFSLLGPGVASSASITRCQPGGRPLIPVSSCFVTASTNFARVPYLEITVRGGGVAGVFGIEPLGAGGGFSPAGGDFGGAPGGFGGADVGGSPAAL